MRNHLLTDTILAEPSWRHICFAEQDAGDAAPGAGGAETSEEDAIAAAIGEEGDHDTGAEESDDAELEIGPDKIKVDKRVKSAWDGLQKTTQSEKEAVAADRRAAQEERQRAQEFTKLAHSFADDISEIKGIDKQLSQYAKLTQQDWIQWGQQDADAANKALTLMGAMKAERDRLESGLKVKIQDAKNKETAAFTEQRAKAEREVASQIKDWSPAKRDEFAKGAAQYGISKDEFESISLHPGALKIIQDALKYRQAAAKAKALSAANKSADEPPPEPVQKARSTGAPARINISGNQSMDSFAENFLKQRKQHLQKKRS